MESFQLNDLIDAGILQNIQDSLSKMTGMAVLITDTDGKSITNGSGFTDYCQKYTRSSQTGCERCEQCAKLGAEAAHRTGEVSTYMCHAGLMESAAPVIFQGEMIACLIGGQVLTQRPPKPFVRGIAKDFGLDFQEYWDALQRVPVVEKEQIALTSDLLSETANVFSDIVSGKIMALEASMEAERVASLKSDFLANMSHEIRTPMNAVIGMAEMALREELSPEARNYITQIKTSGKALLNIINDILDFSKIDSGKMDINPVEYEPVAMLNDVASILMTRIKDKDVELLVSVTPKLPKVLLGDDLRIRQILINLANNAIKFTNKGHVDILVDFEQSQEDSVILKVAVRDTGIGIRKNDLGKLFESFQQVDSKRNRNIEGTGLGLAISQKLLELMDGSIQVESEYEQGSTFSFTLPQTIVDQTPSISVRHGQDIVAIGYFSNRYFAKQFFEDTNRMGVYSIALTVSDRFDLLCEIYRKELVGKRIFLFFDEPNFDEQIEWIIRKNPMLTGVLLTEFFSKENQERPELPNLKIIKKPFSTIQLAMVLNDENMTIRSDADEMFEFDFVAPSAKVLVVDDNSVNLVVTEGLLKPLEMQIVTANSGKMALNLISQTRFDIIFMDHMMPELDGVETTRIIRRLHPSYEDVPIIALTANAMDGSKELFLSEGMNDFVPKPIELKNIVTKIKKWLPHEKIQKGITLHMEDNSQKKEKILIGDLDTDSARAMVGDDNLYFKILKEYYKSIEARSATIREYKQQENWKAYTTEVHALKSISRQIGANMLADMAFEMERAGNALDIRKIMEKTGRMLDKYASYLDVLKPFCEEKEDTEGRSEIEKDALLELFSQMKEAVENLDMDQMENVMAELGHYEYPKVQMVFYEQLKSAVENIDVDTCDEVIENWTRAVEI